MTMLRWIPFSIENSIVCKASEPAPVPIFTIAALQHQAQANGELRSGRNSTLVTSQLTIIEATDGDTSAAADRLKR